MASTSSALPVAVNMRTTYFFPSTQFIDAWQANNNSAMHAGIVIQENYETAQPDKQQYNNARSFPAYFITVQEVENWLLRMFQ